jgi:hypothetical protein
MATKITDGQVRRLWRLLDAGTALGQAATKTGMDRKTARRYRNMRRLPSHNDTPHDWRTRPDPFAEVWPEVEEHLHQAPGLQAKTLFTWLQQKYPGRFDDGQLRTLQRRIKTWRATCGPAKEVFFSQVHHPGRLGASDFTHMSSLDVTIGGQRFAHLVYHFVLTYSNWESVTICFSESFASLCDGLQNALWELGGVPERHRSGRMSSAVNNLSERKEFTERYQSLMAHYGLAMEKTQAGKGNENGDAESLHRHFKDAVAQSLLLRGHRDFASRQEYAAFLQQVVQQRNAGRQRRLAEEVPLLRPLPRQRLGSCQRLTVTVDKGSLIHVQHNVYSVNSRLIGERVEVRIYAEHLEVWYGQQQVETLPRLRGRRKHRIDYRHVIDTLVRKPGAFADYRYRDELFPSSRFRMAYDALSDSGLSQPHKEYLKILQVAARQSESLVEEALRVVLDAERVPTASAVTELVRRRQAAPPVTEVSVAVTDLAVFDVLLGDKEVEDEPGEPGQRAEPAGQRLSAGTAPADDAAAVRGTGAASREGDAGLRGVPAGPGPGRMRSAAGGPHRTAAAAEPDPAGQGPEQL